MKARHVLPLFLAAFALAAHGGEKAIKNGDTLVFMGDSITQFGKDTVDGYLRLVVQGLAANNINVTWYGVGISGQTAVQMKNRFQNDVVAKNPDVCTIFAGVNDCGSNWPVNTNSTPNDVAAMADMAIANGIKPVLLSPTGVNGEGFKQNVCDYAAAVKGIAQARNIPYAQTYEAFRECVDDPANPVINQFGYKATKDGTHMDVVGNRILAREVLKAFGFDATELANAEAAWNANAPFIEFHPSVQITEAEYMAVKAAAGRAGKSLGEYHRDLFYRGAELMKQNPVRVAATSGATVKLSATPLASLVTYDQMIDCGRAMSTHDSVPAIANYAMLAAVHELPAATAADLPTEPVQAVDTSVFSKQVEFTVSGYAGSSTLADFPVAVRLAAGSPTGFRYADMADPASGSELRFADGSGDSLSYEIEQWNPDGASLVWVKVPALSQGASFTMYYGGEPADAVEPRWTWKADYVGVWHMAEANGTVADSVNGLDAEPIGAAAATQQVAADGVFGKARVNSANAASYNGQSMLKVADSTLLDVGDDFTMSAGVKMTALTTVDGLARFASRNRGGGYAPDWELALPNYTTLNGYAGSLTAVSSTVPSAENSWVHLAAVFNGTTLTTYANGVKLADASISAVQDSDNKLIFGAKDKDVVQGHFTGLFDEFRLRDAVSSADWVKAEYDQSSASFLTAGEATDVSGTPHTHTWGSPSYVWSADNATCTATAVCTGNSAHRKTQTATTAYAVVQAPTADADGTGRYTATFTDALFSAQTKDVVLPRTGGGGGHVDPTGAIAPSGDATGAADRNAIQAAIDAAAPTGGTVTLGSGVFYIDAQLMVTNGVTLEGQGPERTIIRQVGTGRVATLAGEATLKDLTATGGTLADQYVHGAGVYVENGTVSWCCISNNTVSGKGGYGGGVFIKQGTIDHSIVAFNTNDGNGGKGAGIGVNGDYSGPVTIDACLVLGNRAAYAWGASKGGGIGMELKNYGSPVAIRNTTIVGNVSGVEGRSSEGGALSVGSDYSSKLTMVNCIVAGNTTMGGNPDVKLHHATNVDYCLFDAADCVTIETSGEQVGAHCLVGDPKFADAAADDYTLASDSPAKGAGATYSGIGKDLMGGDFANPPSMGCYEFGTTPPPPSIALGEPAARPGTDYNGSAVTVAFTGEIPAGAVASAALTIGGVGYAGTIDAANGTLSFAVPAGVVTAGNAYEGTVSLTVDGIAYTKGVTLAQGTIKVDVNAAWIHETASAFGETGAWSGDKAVVADGAIAVSNATFAAAATAPRASVVTISSTFRFGDPSDEPFDTGSRAGITVVRADGANRYAVLTAAGVATNLAVVADVSAAVTVTVTLDDAAHTVSYSVGGTSLGTYALAERQTGVSTVRYVGPTDVVSLDGAYRFDGLDANLARAGGTEYATVADALASGADPVELLWDASWSPAAAGDYVFATNGHALVVGGSLAYRVTDNGDGTVTVTVAGDAATPEPASISVGASTVRVGVSGAKADRWYALEKTTDLAVDFAVDVATWTKGSDLLAGTGELSIVLDENEPAAFYRVVESDVAPSL